MENYRLKGTTKGQQQQVLVPVSFGVSSTVLLHVLDDHQQRQLAGGQGRSAYNLHILNVELPTVSSSLTKPGGHGFDVLRELYPRHKYTTIPFSSIFRYDKEIGDVISKLSAPGFQDQTSKTDQERLDSFKSSLSSATSRTDIEYILLNRLIVAFAKEQGCDGILWGHSDSRLAGRVLADVAKGRGFSLPWQICEGMSPSGLNFNFPLRDLFKSELEVYSSLIPERVSQVIIPERSLADISCAIKAMSIEDMMTQYIETQGAKYPSIMANVVRTVNKLEPPSVHEHDVECALCGMLVTDASKGLVMPGDNLTSNVISIAGESNGKQENYCYGCARSCLDIEQS